MTVLPNASPVLNRYDQLLEALSEKYGKGKSVRNVYEHSDQKDFLMWIKEGRSQWYTNFDTNETFIQLGVGASNLNTGYWRLIVENKSLRDQFEKDKKQKEKGAL